MSVFNSSCYWHGFKDFVFGHLGLPGYPPGVPNQNISQTQKWCTFESMMIFRKLPVWWVPLEGIHLRHLGGQMDLISTQLGGWKRWTPQQKKPNKLNEWNLKNHGSFQVFFWFISFCRGWIFRCHGSTSGVFLYTFLSTEHDVFRVVSKFFGSSIFLRTTKLEIRMKHICVQKTWRMMRGMPGLLTASHVLVNLLSAWSVFSTYPPSNSEFTPENWCLEDRNILLGQKACFQGALAVSFRDDYMVHMLLSLWPTRSRWTISPTHPTDVDSQV